MRASDFDELEFFRRIGEAGARALLIGRRALVVLGLPVLTADYDFWIHIEDIAQFNDAAEPLGLLPTHSPEEARVRRRYVLQNDEHVDVLVARSIPTVDDVAAEFEALWQRRRQIDVASGVRAFLPSLDDLIVTKRFGARPKDLEDIRLLEVLRDREEL